MIKFDWVERSNLKEALRFALTMWALSRLVILIAMLLLAPALGESASGESIAPSLALFAHWDGEHYLRIVNRGYQFRDDGKGYNVAFFPLFPLLIRGGMSLGLSAEAAGVLVNNLAFLGSLVVLYGWVADRHGRSAARWATATLAWCPFSLFTTVVYTEGLFLWCSTSALRAFDRQQYGWASFWGALTTAIRPPGMALIPTFLIVAWREKRELWAYLTALASATGLLLYMLYCGLRFGQPIAFLLTQRGWQSAQDFYGEAWADLWTTVLVGAVNEDKGRIVDLSYPIALLLLVGLSVWLKRSHPKLGSRAVYAYWVLAVLFWLVGGSPLINVVMVFGGAYLVWRFRHELGRVAFVYSVFSWGIILSISRTTSAERYAYGVIPLSIAFGLLLTRHPRYGYATLIFFGILLGSYALRFAQGLWAG